MWYLIVPPIIIIVSVLFLLWYLSEKGSDPSIVEKVSHLDATAHEEVSFFRTKKFFLHILEKIVYRFKVKSLQLHNVLNSTTQSLKEKGRAFQVKKTDEPLPSNTSSDAISVSTSSDDVSLLSESTPVSSQGKELSQDTPSSDSERFSAFRRRTHRSPETEESVVERPMVSEKIVRPEAPYRKVTANVIHEESLIARIATNPKDFSSYEKLGDYYLAVGNIKDAKECYKQVLKLSPAARLVKIKIRRLEKIIAEKG